MNSDHLQCLACPACGHDLALREAQREGDGFIARGVLHCAGCGGRHDVVRDIPRFVPVENYAGSFGLEWTKHAKTQYDGYSGSRISETRFFGQTGWPRDLTGQRILEVGGGSGRFTEQAASTGATVVSIDLSRAVEANYASNGHKRNVLIAQADIYRLPLKEGFFDKLFCFGVLQHTPDPERAFMRLPRYVKPGGSVVVDVYGRWGFFKQLTMTKYWVRPITRRMSPERLYRYCWRYIDVMWPVVRFLRRIPRIGRILTWRLLIADYHGVYRLSEPMLKEWAILDTFDMLSPAYDRPQTAETVRRWFQQAGMADIEVTGEGLIVGRGTTPS